MTDTLTAEPLPPTPPPQGRGFKVRSLAEAVQRRAIQNNVKGKARDNLACDFFTGAALALEMAKDDEANIVGFNAYMIAIRGWSWVEEVLAKTKEKETVDG